MKRKKWIVSKGNKELAALASQELNVDPLAALIVTSRGFKSIDELDSFFEEDSSPSLDPMTIKDMDKAVNRINAGIDNFEMMCVYGDYDCDGVTATALLYSYLESRGANVIRYIPDRISEGYGLNNGAIKKLYDMGVKLIVTVDNGVSAIEETEYAYSLGMQVVVTDHHKVGDTLPVCEAVVDPHRPDCESSFKELAGVGVAFQLVCALEGFGSDELLEEYGEFVALGTIGDVVSLTGENRILVRRGIQNIAEHPGIGVAALIEAAGLKNKPFNSSSAAYTLCPRINAAGRMGSADKALELLLCDDPDEAQFIASQINGMNTERQGTETEIYKKALDIIASNPEIGNGKIIVVDGDGWHQGVVGIVAAKLTEHFGRPSVVISRSGEDAKGSCRSIDGFSIFDAIEAVSDCLTHYGGHTLAAGVGMKSERIDEFRKRINDYAADKEVPFAIQKIDCRIQPAGINLGMLPSLSMLEPYGAGNPQPCFGLFGVTIEEASGISDGKHTRILVSKNGVKTGTVYFGMPDKRFPFEKGDVVDLAVNLEKSIYNGDERVSAYVRGVRPSGTDEQKVLSAISLFDKFSRGEPLERWQAAMLLPDRETQVEVFRSIKAKPLKDNYCEMLCVRLHDDGGRLASFMTAVAVMTEMGVLAVDENNRVYAPENPVKVNLEDSVLMKKLRRCENG